MPSRNMQTFLKLMEDADFDRDLTNEKSHAAMLESFAPDFEIVQPPSLPQGGVHKGREQWESMLATMRKRWKQTIRHDEAWDLPDRDLVVMHSTLEWTSKKTGRSLKFPSVELMWFRDGKISKVEMFFQDTKRILDTLDADEQEPDSKA
jgi:ketosteroid isomerase-like protein